MESNFKTIFYNPNVGNNNNKAVELNKTYIVNENGSLDVIDTQINNVEFSNIEEYYLRCASTDDEEECRNNETLNSIMRYQLRSPIDTIDESSKHNASYFQASLSSPDNSIRKNFQLSTDDDNLVRIPSISTLDENELKDSFDKKFDEKEIIEDNSASAFVRSASLRKKCGHVYKKVMKPFKKIFKKSSDNVETEVEIELPPKIQKTSEKIIFLKANSKFCVNPREEFNNYGDILVWDV